jgi:uroporphyrinogen decarboxylase
MTPRERVVAALNCRTPDRVPVVEYLFSPKLQQALLGYTTPLYDGPCQLALAHKLGLDGMWVPINGFCGLEEEVHPLGASYQDEWGVTYVKNGWPIMVQTDTPIKSRADWSRYRLPKASAPHRTAMLSAAVQANPHELAIIAGFLGPLTMMYWYLMDLGTLSVTIHDEPDLVREMTAAFTAWTLESAQLVADLGGVDAFSISDDWGGTTSLLMSPRHLREFFIPPFRDIVQGMKRLGLPVIMHNDGRIWDVLDDLVDTGINAFHPVERAAGMDLARMKERYRGRLCPIGNINNKTTMVTGTPEDVRREALECLRIAAPGGGYILATDHSLHDDIPLENILAYVGVARQNGTYPFICSHEQPPQTKAQRVAK